MLKPFTDKAYVVPIAEAQLEKITQAARDMQEELKNQRDWYWSCRGRSYFMEIIIALERMYGLIGYGVTHQKSDNTPIIKNAKLRDAVLYTLVLAHLVQAELAYETLQLFLALGTLQPCHLEHSHDVDIGQLSQLLL